MSDYKDAYDALRDSDRYRRVDIVPRRVRVWVPKDEERPLRPAFLHIGKMFFALPAVDPQGVRLILACDPDLSRRVCGASASDVGRAGRGGAGRVAGAPRRHARTVHRDHITLKWGSLKSWNLSTPAAMAALDKWAELGVSLSAATHRNSDEQKALICAIIDEADVDGVHLDWEDETVSKEEAKRYVMNYGQDEGDDDAT